MPSQPGAGAAERDTSLLMVRSSRMADSGCHEWHG